MKKTLLIIAIVLCFAVAGAALAVAIPNNATPVSGTLTADSYLALSLNQCSSADITLSEGDPANYTIQCDVTKSTSVTDTCTLTLTLADGDEVNLDHVTVTLYSDATRQAPVASGSRKGAGTITITGISATTTYYATIAMDDGLDSATTDTVGGTMTLSFAKTAA